MNDYGRINRGSGSRRYSTASTIGALLYFPIMFIYLEFAFHIYMKLSMKYMPLIVFFAVSMGFVCAAIVSTPLKKFNRVMAVILTIIPCVLFGVEIVCKKVLSQYYQLLSSADTAANNKLTDYMGAIITFNDSSYYCNYCNFKRKVFKFWKKEHCFSYYNVNIICCI